MHTGRPTTGGAPEGGFPVWPDPDEVARLFPPFEILERLGRGGMGIVYRARQKSLDRLVALKIIAPERESDDRFRARFAREARILARLNHPGVVTVYDFGESSGVFYLAMEYVEGLSVRDFSDGKRFSVERTISMALSICDALGYAHERGVVHRDIKPENLLLTREAEVKIADFGIAEIMRGEPGVSVTELGAVRHAGTPGYMAPELASAPNTADHRADLFSVAVVLYELLTGTRPAASSPLPLPGLDRRIAARLQPVLRRALEPRPENRFSSAREMGEALRGVVPGPAVAPDTATAKTGSRLRLLFPLIALIAFPLILIVWGYERFFGESETTYSTVPVLLETPPRLDRPSAFSLSPPPGEAPSFVHLDIRGRLDGEAWIADHRLEGEVNLQLSRPLARDETFSFEYIPITATGGELTLTYWFSD